MTDGDGRRSLRGVIGVLALAAAGAGLWFGVFHAQERPPSLMASGTVEATDRQLGFPVAGRIDSMHVQEGDRVERGRVLASLDRTETRARRQQAVARVATARARLRELERGFQEEEVAQARAARDAALQRVTDAKRDVERARALRAGGAASQEAYDKAETAFEIAQSRLTQAEERLRLLEKGARAERIEAQRAQLAEAEAAVRVIDAMLDDMVIVARTDGIVTVRHREPDEIVPPGSPVLTVMNPEDRWVRIYIREDRIGAVRIGQPATLSTDTYPDKRYRGEVTFIASEAEFTPKNVQTAEERVKLVYAVKVRITRDDAYDLKPGMPADVYLDGEP